MPSRHFLLALFVLTLLVTPITPQKAELVVQTGHSGFVTFLKVSPDGKLIASGDQYSLIIWEAATGRQIRTLKEVEPSSDVGIDYRAVSFTPDWRYLIDGTSIVEVATGRRTKPIITPFARIGASVLSRNSDMIAATDASREYVGIWSLKTEKRLALLHASRVTLGRDGTLFAASGPFTPVRKVEEALLSQAPDETSASTPGASRTDGWIHVYSLSTQAEVARLLSDRLTPHEMVFNGDSSRLVSVNDIGLRVWSIVGKKLLQTVKADFRTEQVWTAANDYQAKARFYFNESGDSLVAVRDSDIRFWTYATARFTRIPADDIQLKILGSTGYAFARDGKTFVATRSAEKGVVAEFWDALSGTVRKDVYFTGYRDSRDIPVAFAAADTLALGRSNEVDVYDVSGSVPVKQVVFHRFAHTVTNTSMSLDSRTLALSSNGDLVDQSGVPFSIDLDNRYDAGIYDDAVLLCNLDGTASEIKRLDGALVYSNPFAWNTAEAGSFYHDRYMMLCSIKNDIVGCTIYDSMSGAAIRSIGDYDAFYNGGDTSSISTSRGGEKMVVLSKDLNHVLLATGKGSLEYWDIRDPSGLKNGPRPTAPNELQTLVPRTPEWTHTVPGEVYTIRFLEDERSGVINYTGKDGRNYEATVDVATGAFGNQHEIGKADRTASERSAGFAIEAVNHSTSVSLIDNATQRWIAEVYWLNRRDWVVVDPDGRFDTNLDLGNIRGLHWIVSDDPMKPKPLELFMRQYYEPGLLSRILKCNQANTCGKEFKPLPSIAEINRVQPRLAIPNRQINK